MVINRVTFLISDIYENQEQLQDRDSDSEDVYLEPEGKLLEPCICHV